jgi:RecB family exonuclease
VKRHLVAADSNAALHRAGTEWLSARRGLAEPVLVLAPTRGAGDDFVRFAAQQQPHAGLHRLTVLQWAAALAGPRLAELGVRPSSRLAFEALVNRVIAERRGELRYFAPVASYAGFATAVARTLGELQHAQLSPDQCQGPADSPLADLRLLYAACLDAMDEEGVAGRAELLALATQEALSGRAWHGPAVLLDVAPANAAEQALLRTLMVQSDSLLVLAMRRDEAALEWWRRELGVDAEDAPPAAQGSCASLTAALFATTTASGGPLDFFSAGGEGLEAVEIARRIHALAAAGERLDQMAVLVRNPPRYQPLLEEAFRRAAIPAYFSRGVARPDPGGRAFLALLACAREDCSAARFGEYLSLGQVPELPENPDEGVPRRVHRAPLPSDDEVLQAFARDEEAEAEEPDPEDSPAPATPRDWERLLVDAAVIGGAGRWPRRLQGIETEIRFQIARLQRENDAERIAQLDARLERVRTLQRFALPLIRELDRLPRQATWREWLGHLTGLARQALRQPQTVLALLEELRPLEETGPVAIGEVYDVLAARLRFLQREPAHHRYGRVFVASLAEARGRSFRFVFTPGLAEGLFPQRPMEDPILLDGERRRFPALETREDRARQERLLLLTAAQTASVRLIASYPRLDTVQNRPRVPSFYAWELIRAARGSVPGLREFERQAADAAPTRLDWPAPRDPQAAIDDAEYDLAVLGSASAPGAAHYLTKENPHLYRSLRRRWLRWQPRWSHADGLVAVESLLSGERLTQRAYSPSSLQDYAACPYRFFLRAIQRLEPREEVAPLEQMDPLTRGALFHQVQRLVIEEFLRRGWWPLNSARLAEAFPVADALLDEASRTGAERFAPALDSVWHSEVEELRLDLRAWIQHLVTSGSVWQPVAAEFEFGLPQSQQGVAVLEGGFQVRGAIDLIERHPQGWWRITDHKTGRFPSQVPTHTGGGTVLQPLLYAHAAAQLSGNPVAAGRLYFCTRRGGYQEINVPVDEHSTTTLKQVLHSIDRAIETSALPAAPAAGACARCDYRLVCGPYEEERVRRKEKGPLQPLEEYRSLP